MSQPSHAEIVLLLNSSISAITLNVAFTPLHSFVLLPCSKFTYLPYYYGPFLLKAWCCFFVGVPLTTATEWGVGPVISLHLVLLWLSSIPRGWALGVRGSASALRFTTLRFSSVSLSKKLKHRGDLRFPLPWKQQTEKTLVTAQCMRMRHRSRHAAPVRQRGRRISPGLPRPLKHESVTCEVLEFFCKFFLFTTFFLSEKGFLNHSIVIIAQSLVCFKVWLNAIVQIVLPPLCTPTNDPLQVGSDTKLYLLLWVTSAPFNTFDTKVI